MFDSFLSQGLLKKALDNDKISVRFWNYREQADNKKGKVDDSPYGGGAGMLLTPGPIYRTLELVKKVDRETRTVLLTPQGERLSQKKARLWSKDLRSLTFVCGRYEGFDERIRSFVDEEVCLGDFVMLGGEIASMAIIETISRLLPGVIGNKDSLEQESFSGNLLEYPQYTRPKSFKGMEVPDELISGNHAVISDWREKMARKKTRKSRPDLWNTFVCKGKND
jgi:tRNA (guanine37-N1)-methyltransferase